MSCGYAFRCFQIEIFRKYSVISLNCMCGFHTQAEFHVARLRQWPLWNLVLEAMLVSCVSVALGFA